MPFQALGTGGVASTPGGRTYHCGTQQADGGLPCPFHARGCHEPLSLRALRRSEAPVYLHAAMELYGLSARAYDRILKGARTIADLDAAMHSDMPVTNTLSASQLLQAIQFRLLDRADWGE